MTLLTVVVPAYNVEAYLEQCLNSLKSQAFQDWEAVVVDDGSNDSTLAIAQAAASRDERIRVYSTLNGGASRARNYGIDRATGMYVAFLDGDDWVAPEMYQALMAEAVRGEFDSVSCDLRFQSGSRTWTESAAIPPGEYNRGKIESTFFPILLTSPRLEREWPYRLVTKVYRREFLLDHNIQFAPELRAAQDFTFSVEAMLHAQSFFYVKGLAGYNYRQNPTSRTHSPLARAFENYVTVDEEFERIVGQLPEFDRQRAIARLHGKLSALTYHYRGAGLRDWWRLREELRGQIESANVEAGYAELDWAGLSRGKRFACALMRRQRWSTLNSLLIARAQLESKNR